MYTWHPLRKLWIFSIAIMYTACSSTCLYFEQCFLQTEWSFFLLIMHYWVVQYISIRNKVSTLTDMYNSYIMVPLMYYTSYEFFVVCIITTSYTRDNLLFTEIYLSFTFVRYLASYKGTSYFSFKGNSSCFLGRYLSNCEGDSSCFL